MLRSLLRLTLLLPFALLGCQDSLPTQTETIPSPDLELLQSSATCDVGGSGTAQGARIVTTADIQAEPGNFSDYDLDGADITVTTIIPDLSISPDFTFTSVQKSGTQATAGFEDQSMLVDIVNRPDGAPDELGLTGFATVRVINAFDSDPFPDRLSLTFGSISPTSLPDFQPGSATASLDGTNSAISGTDPVSNLAFLLDFEGILPGASGGSFTIGIDNLFDLVSTQVVIEALSSVATLESLAEEVRDFEAAGHLNTGQTNSLLAKLNAATARLNDEACTPAVNQLEAFVNEVQALIDGGVLTPEQGQPLIDIAEALISDLSS